MNSNKRKSMEAENEKRPLTEWLATKLDIPTDILNGGLRLDMRGRNTLIVHGCIRILDFSPCEIRLALPGSTLTIGGQRLICTSYLAGAVGIDGYICSLYFGDEEVAQ
jgi:sporulation protein YqfC